jgi:hypothetical protein
MSADQLKATLEKMGAKNVKIGGWYICFEYDGEELELNATTVGAESGAEIQIFIQPEVESK